MTQKEVRMDRDSWKLVKYKMGNAREDGLNALPQARWILRIQMIKDRGTPKALQGMRLALGKKFGRKMELSTQENGGSSAGTSREVEVESKGRKEARTTQVTQRRFDGRTFPRGGLHCRSNEFSSGGQNVGSVGRDMGSKGGVESRW
ncbi:hypothetical protein C8R44DRAFT_747103 [Mycena epipterygia]|nr:hypothetical protein C8R44DRAFT_747103 [Mycena epipterygia]